ncbi:hypothetical protein EBP26_00795 [Stutzerimonas stutzeri ATCC 17588 = LMG 11199]|nr:hypothetical protein EBP26_00795 [Stutzerimonas stutzeri ATCC 17588 = LMG 11199]
MSKGTFDDSDNDLESADNGVFSSDEMAASDSLAKREAVAIAGNEDLDTDGKQKEHGRHQRFQEHANNVALGLLWTVAGFTLIGMAVFVWHIVMPESWCWLTETALDSIRTLLTGVLFSSAMSGYVNKRMTA